VNCEELVSLLSDYIDGRLEPGPQEAAEGHLAECDRCHLVLDSTQRTILLYRLSRDVALDPHRRLVLLRRLEEHCARRSGGDPVR
jgi:predicted anti-sigma-YlaC factor YlaD